MEPERMASAETTLKIHDEYSYVFTGIWSFKGTFSLHVNDNAKPYQTLPSCVAYLLHEPFKMS